MTEDLPQPLVPPEVDLVDFAFMRLDVRRLRDSRIASLVSGEEFRCAVLLWCAAWHQRPAASLPDDDIELSQLAGFGRAVAEWQKVRDGALHGWLRCSDGRLYHPVVAEKALEAWAEKQEYRWRRECDRLRKVNKTREAEGLAPLPLPRNPREDRDFPSDTGGGSAGKTRHAAGVSPSSDKSGLHSDGSETVGRGNPAENALKGNGRGNGRIKDKNADPPLRDGIADGKPPPADVISTPQAELFRRGKEILGASSGGLIRKVLTAKQNNVAFARAALEQASQAQDPREYLGAIVAGRDRDAELSARDRGDVW